MKIRHTLVTLSLATTLAACADQTLDGSSSQAMKASVERASAEMSPAQAQEFQDAVKLVAMDGISISQIMEDGPGGAERVARQSRERLDGKTVEEVLSMAERIQAERRAREREQALTEIAELERRIALARTDEAKLAKFEVVRSRFYFEDREYGRDQPVIDITVKNGTDRAISHAYFKGVIASPDRAVPWHSASFNYQIPGGLEPGEQARWQLVPNTYSDWGSVEAPADAVFTVTTYELDGPDGETYLSSEGLSEYDLQRLAELKAQYGQ